MLSTFDKTENSLTRCVPNYWQRPPTDSLLWSGDLGQQRLDKQTRRREGTSQGELREVPTRDRKGISGAGETVW